MTVLILGGTGEARALATALDDDAIEFESSLAGRVRNPRLPVGPVRIGGFGGAEGLARYLNERGIRAVVDATHPFAAGISANAAAACAAVNVPLLRLQRPGWHDRHGLWTWADDHHAAAEAAATGRRIFLSTGRQTLDRFVGPLAAHDVLVRVVDPLAIELPPNWSVLLGRGPYDRDDERSLLLDNRIDTLVTKDSGGSLTRGKLDAADELGVRVIVVRRPAAPRGVATVDSVATARDWVLRVAEVRPADLRNADRRPSSLLPAAPGATARSADLRA
ncbi:cobalt-precorrin-6A reductase [Rhodococcus pyridinivorans]|uniref:Cobalt-precorrin-6X reductase n=1 Tax=Rhodococcus pyridinivorans KG-16 TaxID=1441730 RepID=A0A0V9UQY5_9NOCA|nr:cobalt-precorrin-6A reductase [Rhodococcus pyridinivorans]KSZ60395.1 cobalt-precorrin-6X reductase [Rhodococcus pyridinivorans KG-16]